MTTPAAPPTWNTWATMAWFMLFFVVIGYEVFAGIDHSTKTPMLTHVVCRYIPAPFTIGFIIWLLFHFALRYGNPNYINWLRNSS